MLLSLVLGLILSGMLVKFFFGDKVINPLDLAIGLVSMAFLIPTTGCAFVCQFLIDVTPYRGDL